MFEHVVCCSISPCQVLLGVGGGQCVEDGAWEVTSVMETDSTEGMQRLCDGSN